jgi:hypothetical protein
MIFEKSFKSYSNNQWLYCWDKKWFNKTDILHAIMYKSKYLWWGDNNYNEKLVTEMLSQTTYDFSNIWGIMMSWFILVVIYCT